MRIFLKNKKTNKVFEFMKDLTNSFTLVHSFSFSDYNEFIKQQDTHSLQEAFSSVLGILWCKKFRIKTRKIFESHNWLSFLDTKINFYHFLNSLKKI